MTNKQRKTMIEQWVTQIKRVHLKSSHHKEKIVIVVIDANEIYCRHHFAIHIKSLCCTPNTMLYLNCISF